MSKVKQITRECLYEKKLLLVSILSLVLAVISLLLFLQLWVSGTNFADYQSIENAEIIIFNKLWGIVANFIFLTIFSTLVTFIIVLKIKKE